MEDGFSLDLLWAGTGTDRIACQTRDGRDRSLSQKLPGWNNLLLPKDDWESQIVSEIAPQGDEIIVAKTTDSALTGARRNDGH